MKKQKSCQKSETSPEDSLFEKTSSACKALHKASKKLLRQRARKEWWDKNKPNK